MAKNKNIFEEIIKFNKKEFEDAIEKAYDKKKETIKIDGFRKGKVPFDTYVKKMGKQSLYMDALDILLPEAYDKALKDYKPIIDPKVDIKSISEDGVEFLFTITTMPEVNIKKYKGLNVEKEKVEVKKEEIDHELSHLLERFTELAIKDGKVEKGNIAVIDFEGFLDNEPFDGGKGENYSLEIGSNTFIPGFEDQVINMEKGEEKDIKVTFPEDYHAENLKGKEVVFKVKVHEIKEKQIRELDEEFFEDLGLEGITDEKGLRKEIKENIKVAKERQVEDKFVDEILSKIAENTKVDIPDELIHEEIHHMMHNFEDQMRMQGLSLDVYYEMTKSTEDDLHKQMEPEAKKHVLYRMILETIKDKEKISVSDKEAEKEAEKIAAQYNIEKDDFIKQYGGIEMLKYELEVKAVLELLMKENEKK